MSIDATRGLTGSGDESREKTSLAGLRVLIVDDWFMVAQELQRMAASAGCEVIGPIGDLDAADQAATDELLDGAILDVNINGREIFPVADKLVARGIPFIFVTGYDAPRTLPDEFRDSPVLEKPFQQSQLIALMEQHFVGHHTGAH